MILFDALSIFNPFFMSENKEHWLRLEVHHILSNIASIIWFLTTLLLILDYTLFTGNFQKSYRFTLLRILSESTMSRPKTAGERNESIMVEKAKKAMEKTKDPVEKLRFVPAHLKVNLHCKLHKL